MAKPKTQIKFAIDSEIVYAFKARCSSEGVSMASVVSNFMKTNRPAKTQKTKTETRPHRRKAVLEIVGLLYDIMERETGYRDGIPEQFHSRYDAADHACEQLEEAISRLEDAY